MTCVSAVPEIQFQQHADSFAKAEEKSFVFLIHIYEVLLHDPTENAIICIAFSEVSVQLGRSEPA